MWILIFAWGVSMHMGCFNTCIYVYMHGIKYNPSNSQHKMVEMAESQC